MAGRAGEAGAGENKAGTDVDLFMARLEHPLKAEIEALRAIIRAVDPRIQERIKWNAPSFYITEHFATFKLRPLGSVQLVLHTGAKIKEQPVTMQVDHPVCLLKWAAKDRAVATFADMQEIQTKQAALSLILKQWIAQL